MKKCFLFRRDLIFWSKKEFDSVKDWVMNDLHLTEEDYNIELKGYVEDKRIVLLTSHKELPQRLDFVLNSLANEREIKDTQVYHALLVNDNTFKWTVKKSEEGFVYELSKCRRK